MPEPEHDPEKISTRFSARWGREAGVFLSGKKQPMDKSLMPLHGRCGEGVAQRPFCEK
jgi:hypothetical protein